MANSSHTDTTDSPYSDIAELETYVADIRKSILGGKTLSDAELVELRNTANSLLDATLATMINSKEFLRATTEGPMRVLIYIESFPNSTLIDIANDISLTRSRITQIVNNLVDSGLAVKKPDENDHRKIHLELTEEGHRACNLTRYKLISFMENYVLCLGMRDAREAIRLLQKTADIVASSDLSGPAQLIRTS